MFTTPIVTRSKIKGGLSPPGNERDRHTSRSHTHLDGSEDRFFLDRMGLSVIQGEKLAYPVFMHTSLV